MTQRPSHNVLASKYGTTAEHISEVLEAAGVLPVEVTASYPLYDEDAADEALTAAGLKPAVYPWSSPGLTGKGAAGFPEIRGIPQRHGLDSK